MKTVYKILIGVCIIAAVIAGNMHAVNRSAFNETQESLCILDFREVSF